MADVKCILCGEKIEKKKGQSENALKAELDSVRHYVCATAHQSVVKDHNVGVGQHMNAVMAAVFEKFPDLKETEAYREYDIRVMAAEAKMLEMFPYLAALKEAEEKEEKKKAKMQTGTEQGKGISGTGEGEEGKEEEGGRAKKR